MSNRVLLINFSEQRPAVTVTVHVRLQDSTLDVL